MQDLGLPTHSGQHIGPFAAPHPTTGLLRRGFAVWLVEKFAYREIDQVGPVVRRRPTPAKIFLKCREIAHLEGN